MNVVSIKACKWCGFPTLSFKSLQAGVNLAHDRKQSRAAFNQMAARAGEIAASGRRRLHGRFMSEPRVRSRYHFPDPADYI